MILSLQRIYLAQRCSFLQEQLKELKREMRELAPDLKHEPFRALASAQQDIAQAQRLLEST